jgi:hypothetical protein
MEMRNAFKHNLSWEIFDERDHMGDLGVDGKWNDLAQDKVQ